MVEGTSSSQRIADILLEVLNRRLSHGKCQDRKKYVAIVEDLLRAEVCFRCVLRILKHTTWEDYALDEPDWRDLLRCLQQAVGLSTGQEHKASEAQGQAVEEGAGPLAESCEGQPSTADAGGPVEPCSSSGAERSFTAPVCSLCLGLLQKIQGRQEAEATDPEPAGPGDPHSGQEAAAAASPPGSPFSSVLVSRLSPGSLCRTLQRPGVEFSSFAIEVSLPPSTVLRDRILAEHMSSKYGWMGIFKHNSDQAIAIKVVLRRVLGSLILKQLGEDKKFLDGGTDLTLNIALEHPGARLELRPLIEDHVIFQRKKQNRSQPNPGGEQMSNRQRKKQRRQGLPEPEAPPAPAPEEAVEKPEDCQGDGVGPARQDVDLKTATDMLLASISMDKALGQVQSVPSHVFKRLFPWPLKSLGQPDPCTLQLRLTRASVFLAGRYLKLQRGMPQSRWFDPQTGQRIGCVSLAERIEEAVLPVYAADESKFVSGGREDADVRMLNEGRPFVLELINPQHVDPSAEELAGVERALEEAQHGARAIQLTPCAKKAMDKIKEAEESKQKTYLAFCWAERPLTPEDIARLLALKDLVVMQDTPLRVLHRRAPMVRSKTLSVESVEVVPEKPRYFSIKLRTQAGTYIKEFCHGDLGRTQPNLGTILDCRTEILQLDVVAVHMPDWP